MRFMRGAIFAQSQSSGKMLEMSYCVTVDWRIGPRTGAQDFRIRTGIGSGPVALLVSGVSNNSAYRWIPSHVKGDWRARAV